MSNNPKSKRVLVAPLDWGLGHATRCIPIIKELKRQQTEVFIASSGDALLLLKKEFPEMVFFEIASYRVHYSRALPFMVSMFFQLPKFMNAIRKERREVEKIVSKNNIDVIISDNRFGCRVEGITSIFITHQVSILMPDWLGWIAPIVNRLNQNQIRQFDQCWVPDEKEHRITGRLTEASQLKLKFIGMLSRFERKVAGMKYDLLVLLSGPEPQRTMMEDKMVKQLVAFKGSILIVRGLPGKEYSNLSVGNNIDVKNYLTAAELNQAIEESELVICRSGYSTIMDLMRLNKRAIFIPTSGQTEQEYLAKELAEKKLAYCTTLDELNLAEAMKRSSTFPELSIQQNDHLLQEAIKELML